MTQDVLANFEKAGAVAIRVTEILPQATTVLAHTQMCNVGAYNIIKSEDLLSLVELAEAQDCGRGCVVPLRRVS